jgi:uncharacterized membrane protein
MIEFIYDTLARFGFEHPLHPPFTHLPMGLVTGGFLFSLASFKKAELIKTAHHCFSLALVFVVPTMIAGIMDWQHRFLGKGSGLITAKIVLGLTLTVLLAVAVALGKRKTTPPKLMPVIYGLCLINAVGLGYIGGELTFG